MWEGGTPVCGVSGLCVGGPPMLPGRSVPAQKANVMSAFAGFNLEEFCSCPTATAVELLKGHCPQRQMHPSRAISKSEDMPLSSSECPPFCFVGASPNMSKSSSSAGYLPAFASKSCSTSTWTRNSHRRGPSCVSLPQNLSMSDHLEDGIPSPAAVLVCSYLK